MKTKTKAIAATAVLVAAGAAVALSGVIPSSSVAHPPCDKLPTVADATQGLARNQGLADGIRALGDGIAVGVDNPCGADEDHALIKVTYASDSELDAINGYLVSHDGFGVPVFVAER